MANLAENNEVTQFNRCVYDNRLEILNAIENAKHAGCQLTGIHAVLGCFHIKYCVPRVLGENVLKSKAHFVT